MFGRICHISALLVAILLVACVEDDVRRGNDALRIGDHDRAVQNFSKALDVEPANRDARYGLALSYYAMAEEAETETEDPAAGLALPFLDLLAAAEAETETELLPEEEAVPRLQAESGPAEGTSDTGEASSGTAEGIGEAAGITLPLTGGRSTQP